MRVTRLRVGLESNKEEKSACDHALKWHWSVGKMAKLANMTNQYNIKHELGHFPTITTEQIMDIWNHKPSGIPMRWNDQAGQKGGFAVSKEMINNEPGYKIENFWIEIFNLFEQSNRSTGME